MTAAQRRRSEAKGRPTPARDVARHDVAKANRRATLQWNVVFAVIAVLLVGFAVLGPSGGGPTHTRAPIAGHGG